MLPDGMGIDEIVMPWLTQPTIKWESSPGKIIENHLFVDKFKMVVTLRIGRSSFGKSGKSSLINQLFFPKNMFSCCGEPGAEGGIPVTLDGSVEFVWLTQETASPKLWESVLQKHYESGDNEILLLANIHGNALDFENQLRFLKTIASSFIFFIMPEDNKNLDEDWNKLEEILEIKEEEHKTFYVAIDPSLDDMENYPEELVMDTSKIVNDYNIDKLRNVLKNSLSNPGKKIDVRALQSFANTKVSELIETDESRALVEFVEQNSCKKVKNIMSMQRGTKTHEECVDIWEKSDMLKRAVGLIGDVLSLESESRLKAMIHIEKELNRISAIESAPYRQEFLKYLDQLQKTIGASGEDLVMVSQFKEQVKRSLMEIDHISLGLEHFYREIGKLYEIFLANSSENNPYEILSKKFAELFVGGQAIELLDGDSGRILGPWLSAIFDNVYQMFPGLRIFVISILGLQSSGKSTLLNALFACKFAVSVGRCTRGLFMRLLFIDEKMKANLNFDAILLIDTEGLGAPEKQNEADAEKKDRIMATFAMGISHLTIVNVLGEYMRDLTEILQIAIVAMARLEKADISPNILIVQHLSERNSDKMNNAGQQFGDALQNAIDLADEKDVDLGIKHSKCLKILRHTISTGKLFSQFRPFKNGASVYSPPSDEYHKDVVELYKTIIEIAETSPYKADFKNWQILVNSYWDSIKDENLMRFKDVKDLQEYLERGEIIAKVKESIESAFREHSEILKGLITELADMLNKNEITRESALITLKEKLKLTLSNCQFEPKCEKCLECVRMQSKLFDFVAKKPSEHETKLTIHKFINKTINWHLNQLSQMMSAIAFKQIESTDTLDKINKRLRSLLKNGANFNEAQINSMTEEIWSEIEKEASYRVMQTSISDQIQIETNHIYQENKEFVMNLESCHIDNLNEISAKERSFLSKKLSFITGSSSLLNTEQTIFFEDNIRPLSDLLFNENNVQNYQAGMVAQLKRKVDKIIKDFETINKLRLKIEFKWILHIYANQIFRQKMLKFQQKWDEQHNPLTILRNNKSRYTEVIRERLRYGFSYDSEGRIAGKQLLDAIKEKVLEKVNEKNIYDVLSIGWLTNSSSVRLKYFSELVEKVKIDNFTQALAHFKNPKMQIEKWFIRKVDESLKGNDSKYFIETLKLELGRVTQEIIDCSSVEEIRKYIKNYLSLSDRMKLEKVINLNKSNKADIEIFTSRIMEVLDNNRILSDITFKSELKKPSEDNRVMKRMGCNIACPLCSALCWGERGHDDDEGENKKHHTCHQPMGLSGVHKVDKKNLVCNSCDDQKDDDRWNKSGSTMTWSEMKCLEKYQIYKYETHVKKQFNDLMKWFFLKLNKDIAESRELEPPYPKDMVKYGINTVKIKEVMAVINSGL